MARIAGVTLPNNKCVGVALTAIYGVGNATAQKVLALSQVDGAIRVKDLSEDQVNTIRTHLEKTHRLEADLKRDVLSNIKRLKDIACYRGVRHMKRLPVRGQRTKTNSRTIRGNVRRTTGSGKRVLTKT